MSTLTQAEIDELLRDILPARLEVRPLNREVPGKEMFLLSLSRPVILDLHAGDSDRDKRRTFRCTAQRAALEMADLMEKVVKEIRGRKRDWMPWEAGDINALEPAPCNIKAGDYLTINYEARSIVRVERDGKEVYDARR